MNNTYLYMPEVCDGDYCCRDCDRCPKRFVIVDMFEEEDVSFGE